MSRTDQVHDADEGATGTAGSLLLLGLLAPLAGLGAGVIGALFRWVLARANQFRDALIAHLGHSGVGGFVLLVALAAMATAIAAWLAKRIAPSAAGSGIPRVEAVLREQVEPAPLRVIPVKFVAGTLAIGSGLALGREGPSVQMGASIAYHLGRLFRRSWADCRALLAAGAGAGLATAFNAPIAGALFVLERLVRRFEARMAMVSLAASAVAIWVARALLGNTPDDRVHALLSPGVVQEPLYLLLGVAAGFAGMLYNRTVLAGLGITDRLGGLPVELRAAIVGAAVGSIAWFAPGMVGGGDAVAQQALDGMGGLAVIPLIFLFRLLLIACSVSSGAPGGLLAPFLVLGAELGVWFGKLFALLLPALAIQPEAFALVGMAALFAGILRAPLTGIVLVTEMTNDATLLLPMIVACSAAMLVPALFGNSSILDALGARALARRDRHARVMPGQGPRTMNQAPGADDRPR
ncbi:H(+)/Cl(-) exchange transporter ClcA [Dyella sp. A6]|uniref:H(+)/Cl(-) exchange transporter ClcA n=1 Tax=Dyella aluminiiresistens TaxID=3069105 RepID=UPI002E795C9C|nr:H(+)/Cl(-) exchange transporter ClcA [Dyella sp. A6]